ncbi:hypothetical protein B5E64_01550 [Drancourtella sp. An12]|uniref:hypothetical protein n=1 Tax=Drancourtella sp. An12 TaxID=1965548 RepID=UPI000B3685FA|nr:hypothetical protein [Drancourtella sp. An12]OUQ47669.1 hypothetical protein B5E64_01550 [Drancourtella sp. An12]
MKEYEYIVLATNEVFSHMITSTICLENYLNDSAEEAFRKVFVMFNQFREDYKKNMEKAGDSSAVEIETARFKTKCRVKREAVLKSFINELKEIDNEIDYDNEVRKYYNRIEKEDVETLEMQLMIYPYLMSLVRKKEEE